MKITPYFDNLKQIISNELYKSSSNVFIAVAWINFKEYREVLNALLEKEIDVNIICSDNIQNRLHIEIIDELIEKGAKIRLLEMPKESNYMHHKFVVIDKKTVLNGSFNWSRNAEKSFENLIVIEDAIDVAQEFISEFKKLNLIKTETIQKLDSLEKCPECKSGEIVNILVFSEKVSKYFDTSGDIVNLCTECDYYLNENNMITNNQLFILADSFNSNEEDHEKISDLIFDELNQYINHDTTIHAIGQVYNRLSGHDEDEFGTKILWTNKLVGNKIQDEYEDQNFDVNYDTTSYL